MREIKFRGRRKNSSEWVYGAFLAIPKLCSYIYDVQPDGQATRYLVDEDTVGQFTGLLDNNGKEIYEGDILRFAPPWRWVEDERRVGVVVYKYFAFVVKYGNKSVGIFNLASNEAPYTIIGNIHDNPDLMEAEDARD